MPTFDGVRPGMRKSLERVVRGSLLTTHVGGKGVFASPAMIGLMEWASHRAVSEALPDGFTTVGYEVHVRHLAPTAPGGTVVVTSELKEVEGNKLLFEVSCSEGERLVGKGVHRRAIVPAQE